MDRFAQFAFSTALRDASFVALAAVTLMVGFSFNPRWPSSSGRMWRLFSRSSFSIGSPC